MSNTPALDALLAKPINRNPYQSRRFHRSAIVYKRRRIKAKFKCLPWYIKSKHVLTPSYRPEGRNGPRSVRAVAWIEGRDRGHGADKAELHEGEAGCCFGVSFDAEARAHCELFEPARFVHLFDQIKHAIAQCDHPRRYEYLQAMAQIILAK